MPGITISLEGKKAVVTGGNRGIGLAVTEELGKAGASVIVVARNPKTFEEECEAGGKLHYLKDQLQFIHGDFADTSSTQSAAKKALEASGGTIDILVNCAGITFLDEAEQLSIEKFDKLMAVNVRAPFIFAQTCAPRMKAQRSGKIVNVSSLSSVRSLPLHSAYCASKAALDALTRSWASEWGCYNIQINSVLPTIVMTDMGKKVWGDPVVAAPMLNLIPARRFGEPNEVADLVLFLSSNKSDWISGQAISIDGGITSVTTSCEIPEEQCVPPRKKAKVCPDDVNQEISIIG
eukprot:CAMPEP_0113933784 /NCGR_PEP_ID=MMETSP1339-20121228/1101_1 /TAXON_ID=94617 /ORGANISM="Fibrocapsa japonica" /LENGTH=291 /DNA_ID=CAMNT_0000935251 /DNA_START=118 /DNA_END=993 /DNA_ORIENTATION=- /assembly_acc=CAM_ASM_000762